MNVTLKLPDELCILARHRAVDESKSLSGWIADLVAESLKKDTKTAPVTLLALLGDESLAEGDLELPDRRKQLHRSVEFP